MPQPFKMSQGIKTFGDENPEKCRGKLDCVICKMLFIKEKKPKLKRQERSAPADGSI